MFLKSFKRLIWFIVLSVFFFVFFWFIFIIQYKNELSTFVPNGKCLLSDFSIPIMIIITVWIVFSSFTWLDSNFFFSFCFVAVSLETKHLFEIVYNRIHMAKSINATHLSVYWSMVLSYIYRINVFIKLQSENNARTFNWDKTIYRCPSFYFNFKAAFIHNSHLHQKQTKIICTQTYWKNNLKISYTKVNLVYIYTYLHRWYFWHLECKLKPVFQRSKLSLENITKSKST